MVRKATVEGIELEDETRGTGEPVVFIHPGIFADWFTPLLEEPALTDHFYLIHFHRAGCVGSGHISGQITFAQQAAHCHSLMHQLGIAKAHVVGHSSSAIIALQLALDAPDAVHSLALLEPAFMDVPSAKTSRAFVATAMQRYQAGDKVGAIDIFLQGTCGPDYRAVLDRQLPRGFEQYVADAGTFFEQELQALQQWRFTKVDANRITQPALAVIGEKSKQGDRIWSERHGVLLDWLPNIEQCILADAAHLLQEENPHGMANALASFWTRHPIPS
jgi:pimeloyl-ACP methyl ester carboxylesterase